MIWPNLHQQAGGALGQYSSTAGWIAQIFGIQYGVYYSIAHIYLWGTQIRNPGLVASSPFGCQISGLGCLLIITLWDAVPFYTSTLYIAIKCILQAEHAYTALSQRYAFSNFPLLWDRQYTFQAVFPLSQWWKCAPYITDQPHILGMFIPSKLVEYWADYQLCFSSQPVFGPLQYLPEQLLTWECYR